MAKCEPWKVQGGQSRSDFWKTSDNRFIIKTVVKRGTSPNSIWIQLRIERWYSRTCSAFILSKFEGLRKRQT
ncbi:hypothetical protein BGY98DRAFT_1011159 [Russula aff. rugulosa BPL654]|nr:hypothetical protein BGY98DRAFT_1011159 [Russula aff. rugulosa BPL654]